MYNYGYIHETGTCTTKNVQNITILDSSLFLGVREMRSAVGTLAPPPSTYPGSAPSPLSGGGGENRPGEVVLSERAGPGAFRAAPSKLMRQTKRHRREAASSV